MPSRFSLTEYLNQHPDHFQKDLSSAGTQWIQKAVKHRGSLLEEARQYGYEKATPFAKDVAEHPEEFSRTTRKRAHLALTLAKVRRYHQLSGGKGVIEHLIGLLFPSAKQAFINLDKANARSRRERGLGGGAFELVAGRPKVVQKFLDKYGSNYISQLRVCRVPLSSKLTSILNLFTLGKLNSEVKRLGYETFFHLYLVITFDNGQTVVFDKNERVMIRFETGGLNREGAECRNCRVPPSLTLDQLVINTEMMWPLDRLYIYQVASTNCQQFAMDVLEANKMLTSDLKAFIMQDLSGVISKSGVLSKLANNATDFAHRIKAYFQGGRKVRPKTRRV